jgi:hypothetical protein
MKRIYVSLSSVLYDLYRLRVTFEDIDCVVSNTAFPDIDIAIQEFDKPEIHSEAERAFYAQAIPTLWDRIIQPRLLLANPRYDAIHNSSERYFEIDDNLNLDNTADRILIAYAAIWVAGGWVWNSWSPESQQPKAMVFRAIEELRIRQSSVE